MRASILVLAGGLVACSSAPPQYARPGVEEAAYQREVAGCEMEAAQGQSNWGWEGAWGSAALNESYDRIFDACMRSKGYARVP